ncbi:MAG: CBS domain-containing protein [Pirellulales bacterium]|jgi:CBS domain-containing protein
MLICPFCGDENIDGADVCEQCQQPLEFLSKPRPASRIEYSLVRDRVYMLAPGRPVVVEADTRVRNVLRLLVDRKVGCVVVVRRTADAPDAVVGIFSERDALLRLNTDVAEVADQPISQFMTPSPEMVESDASIAFALHKMDIGGYRHLPVLTDGRTSGVISIRDILRYVTDGLLAADLG